MADPTGHPSDNGTTFHRPLDASRLRDIVGAELRRHRDVRLVEMHRSVFRDRLAIDVNDHFGNLWRVDFVKAPAAVWSRP